MSKPHSGTATSAVGPDAAAIPAASLILFRDGDDPGSSPEHLMIKRSAAMAFAPGALVFPGGRIEPDDFAIARQPGLVRNASGDTARDAAAVAAVRESLEETGISIGIDPPPSPALLRDWRRGLKAGLPFGPMLETYEAIVDLAELLLFARWLPKLSETRRFDTYFFLARIGREQVVEVDVEEAASHHWFTAAEAIAAADRGEHRLVFPTQRNLERLTDHAGFDAARRHIDETPVQIITPEIRHIEGEDWLCIPADAGYPIYNFRMADLLRKL
jgi:8-oxo-dGTP pyrophosphatase MutT (NUDIX family)